jgi:hypothetical protein
LDPKLPKWNWSQEEEQKLLDSVRTHGDTAWTKVAADLGNRSDVQCRFRYRFLVKKGRGAGTDARPVSAPSGQSAAVKPDELGGKDCRE